MKLRKFYALLVEDTVNVEELNVMHKESRRDIKELRNEFRDSKSFYVAFVIKNLLELFLSLGFAAYICLKAYGTIYECGSDGCTYLNYMPCELTNVRLLLLTLETF